MNDFLPVNKEDMAKRGWDAVDFVYVSGDAYVDHPSFGSAIITRVLENAGYRVGFLSQPDITGDRDFTRFGRPKLGFFVSSGNIDSMVAHYTVAKKKRNTDYYTAGGKAGKRPDRAVDKYCGKIRSIYGDIPIIIGGLEASLRRFAHYDYWADEIRPSILVTSGADLISYGMGEKQTVEIADRLKNGESIRDLRDIKGTCYLCDVRETPYGGMECPSLDNVLKSKKEYAVSVRIQQDEQDFFRGRTVKQKHGKMMLVQNPPMDPLSTEELDRVYELPYMRAWHPSYDDLGGVPGFKEVEFSITHVRGCFGACNFCSLAFHQGRYITSRSKESVLKEAKLLTERPNFKGYIHDVGGPTANFRFPSCKGQEERGLCKGKKCLAPKPCPNLISDESEYLDILRAVREIPGVKKVFIRSGIRFDYLMLDKNEDFFKELVQYHVSGQLKVAPEHCSAQVLDKMGKPHIESYIKFAKRYFELTSSAGKEQYIVPYLMSSHPGSTLEDAVQLAVFIRDQKLHPEQVQDFYPTPGTISTAMYYTGLDPYTLDEVYVAKNPHEKAMQRALMRYFDPKNRSLVEEALVKTHHRELIGSSPKCLIPGNSDIPKRKKGSGYETKNSTKNKKKAFKTK
ncbi:MAG: YgiQ family radical SAM protein [Clostridiales bacterium]|nr:YgiQ family radical SAM protein [Clostridiales bacterium]